MLLKKYRRIPIPATGVLQAKTIEEILLLEARAAKHFWKEFRSILFSYQDFKTRKPYAIDTANRLLDVGYHHLTNIVRKNLAEQDVSTAMGLLHVAHASDSEPLAYDLVELFRSDIIDTEVLRFLKLKKRTLTALSPKDIAHFLHEVNERLERKHYLKDFKACHIYRYYMEVQTLKFIKAVNRKQVFSPLYLPTRHESRCNTASLTAETEVV